MVNCCCYRQLAEAGAHVVMGCRNTKAAHDLIQKWQKDWCGMGSPLDIEVCILFPCRFSKLALFWLGYHVFSEKIWVGLMVPPD